MVAFTKKIWLTTSVDPGISGIKRFSNLVAIFQFNSAILNDL